MSNKTLAIVSYITIIGWLITYFSYKDQQEKSTLVSYHLEQGLGVFIFSVIVSIAVGILSAILPALSLIFSLISLVPLILLILGIINAANEVCKPVPVIGKFFEKKFGFLA
ncbi:DUF4870 domain-containing protein [Niabella beijingensis]|uniref:DUF4870 domain-containing protein n=1 Tax=Niabella beijingensis TaxID=2872700 RepID=UPI001CC1030D|nr:DUF4870 domain-containing protein [Niabella beijingensis]MBZ4191958.1 DUF4870 domain-containing protein [Niabella beijingensis]